jgi:hypothetical protein
MLRALEQRFRNGDTVPIKKEFIETVITTMRERGLNVGVTDSAVLLKVIPDVPAVESGKQTSTKKNNKKSSKKKG